MKTSFYAVLAMILSAVAPRGIAFAGEGSVSGAYCDGGESCTIKDYNVGISGQSLFEIGESARIGSAGGGVFANAEFSYLKRETLLAGRTRLEEECQTKYGNDNAQFEQCWRKVQEEVESDWTLHQIEFFDARLMSLLGFRADIGSSGEAKSFFSLRLVGSLSAGYMLYQLIPLNIAAEDLTLTTGNGKTQGTALVGPTFVIPVSTVLHMSQDGTTPVNLTVSVTAGLRANSELIGSPYAFQPKVRFINDRVSLEASYLSTVGSTESERKGSILAAVNHVFGHGDQIGVMATYDQIRRASGDRETMAEVLFFFGTNL